MVVAACWTLTAAGVPLLFYDLPPPVGYQMSIYCWVVSFVLFPLFYPFTFLKGALIIVQNFWINGIVLLGLAVLPFFQVPTVLSGILLSFAGIMYIIAAIRREKGESLESLMAGGAAQRPE
jgi:hypothetical protein